MSLSPAQKVIVACHERLSREQFEGDVRFPDLGDEDIYTGVDHAVARELGVPVDKVGAALVAAGKRPPVWWAG